jgi:hypothetical protein
MRVLLEVPLVWFAAAFALGWLLHRRSAGLRWLQAAEGAASAAILLGVAALNVATAGFLVSFGANVLGIAATHRNGRPMYHAVGGTELYSLVYGPYTYLVYEPLLHGWHALPAIKLELFCVALLTLASVFLLLRRRTGWHAALALTGFGAAVLLAVPAGVLGVRGDMWAVLALTLALLAIETRHWFPAALGVGVCCGFVVDLKLTLVVEALLVLTMLWRRHGGKAAAAGAAFAVAVGGAPLLTANISWHSYVAWLRLSGNREMFASLLVWNCLFAAMLLLPAALAWDRDPAGHWPERLLAAVALLSAWLAGSESGGGPWHLWPLLPFVLVWTAQQKGLRDTPRFAAALAFAALVLSARYGFRAIRIEMPYATRAARALERDEQQELAAIAEAHPETRVEMAPGATMTSDADDLRYFLVYWGEPYEVDMVAAGEALKTDPGLLEPLVAAAASCGTDWTVPHGEIPFSTVNNNETRAVFPMLFPTSVRAAFLGGHHLVEQGAHYDLWAGTSKRQSTTCE